MSTIRQFQTVSNPQEPQILERVGVGVLKTDGSTGEAPSEYGVSARRLLVRGKGDLDRPTFSNVSVIQQPEIETIVGRDDRIRILDPETLPWRMICALEIQGTIFPPLVGTGWFAGPKTIITAGHCVFHPQFLGGWAKEIKIFPGRDGAHFPFPKDSTQQPLVSKKFDALKGWTENQNIDFDYAAIHLDKPVGNETGWFSIAIEDDASLEKRLVNISGYPGDLDYGQYQYFCAGKINKAMANRFFYEIDTGRGQSGAPVWFQDDTDEPVVTGIHNYGISASPPFNTGNSASRITAEIFNVLKGWIDADS